MIDYPQEHYIELQGLSPHFVGRVVIFQHGQLYNVEIDIVQSETGKIYNHVKSLFGETDARDALDSAVHYLKQHFDQLSN